jgi:hypothetical protein
MKEIGMKTKKEVINKKVIKNTAKIEKIEVNDRWNITVNKKGEKIYRLN